MWKISKTTRLSSYPKYFKMKVAAPLFRRDFLSECALPDSLAGMRRYAERLELQEEADPKKKDALQKKYVKGWAIAGKVYKKKLHADFKKMDLAKDWGGRELQELNEMSYEDLVVRWLRKRRKTQKHIDQDKKSANWKITLARELRKQPSATNPWIAQRLNMGDPSNVSRHIHATPNFKG